MTREDLPKAKAATRPVVTGVVMPKKGPIGAARCAACHGNIRPADPSLSRILKNEHTTWLTQDKHANAYQVLSSERARAIATALSGGKRAAHEDARCLACHTTPGLDPSAGDEPTLLIRSDGVGCESCHGPANRWLTEHQQAGWSRLAPSEKEAFGMRPLKELDRRAEVCAGCHVGAPAGAGRPRREVSHELIKAGHPRLNFAFEDYLARMPAHWVEDRTGAFPARAWAIGQVIAARSALGLLEARAKDATAPAKAGDVAWPERSEYDCFSCHLDRATNSWRKEPRAEEVRDGTPPWGTWYYPMVLALAHQEPGSGTESFPSCFETLRATMGPPIPPPDRVADEADQAARALDRWLRTLAHEPVDSRRVRGWIDAVEATATGDSHRSWDQDALRYLALRPLRQSLKALDPTGAEGSLDAALDELSRKLESPDHPDLPRGFDPGSLFRGR